MNSHDEDRRIDAARDIFAQFCPTGIDGRYVIDEAESLTTERDLRASRSYFGHFEMAAWPWDC